MSEWNGHCVSAHWMNTQTTQFYDMYKNIYYQVLSVVRVNIPVILNIYEMCVEWSPRDTYSNFHLFSLVCSLAPSSLTLTCIHYDSAYLLMERMSGAHHIAHTHTYTHAKQCMPNSSSSSFQLTAYC